MYNIELFGLKFSLQRAADAIDNMNMDLQSDHSLLTTLCKPQVVFSVACLSLTILAVANVWSGQHVTPGKSKQSGRNQPRHQIHESSSDIPDAQSIAGGQQSSHIDRISQLTAACAELSRLLHSASIRQEGLREDVMKALEEASRIIGNLSGLQSVLLRDPTFFFDKTGLAAVFETTASSLFETCAKIRAKCNAGIVREDLDYLTTQLRNGRSTLEFLKTNLEPHEFPTITRPIVRFGRTDSVAVPGHKRSLTVPVPQHSTDLNTPGADIKKWLEGPPEPESILDSEPLPEYTALPPPTPSSPSKSNTAAKRNAVSMADIHATLESTIPSNALQKLLRTGVDANATYGRLSRTALQEAARYNKSCCIEVLVDHGALINTEDGKGDTALHLAAWEGHFEACATLIDAGAEMDRLSGRDGCSPLFCAIGGRHIELVRLFLREGAQVWLRSPTEMYPIHQAAVTGQTDACQALLAAGAQADVRDTDGNTPLHNAAAIGNLDTVELLLESGAAVDAKSERGMTALHWASHKGHEAVVKALLDAGADEDEQEHGGATPLCCAASRGHVGCVKTLLKRGANRKLSCEAWDGGSGPPAQLAKRNGHNDVVALLKTYAL